MDNNIVKVFENLPSTKKFSKGDIIYYQEDNATSFYFLKKGKIRVYMISLEGMEKTLSIATAGELLGEASFFEKKPRISCAKALTNGELTVITSEKLTALIKENPEIAMELLKIQATKIVQLSTQIDSITFLQAEERIAKLLLQYKQKQGEQYIVSLTHEEIAGMIGVSRITVSKTLKSLEKKGLLKTGYRKIIIQNLIALENLYT